MGLQAEGAEWAIAAGIVGSDLVFSVRNVGYVRAAGDVVRAVVEGLGVGGGHRSMAKGIIPLRAFRKVYAGASQAHIRAACARRSCTRSTASPPRRARGPRERRRMLDDLLRRRLALVVCGSAAGNALGPAEAVLRGARQQVLADARARPGSRRGSSPRRSIRQLLSFGIGLTDLVKRQSRGRRRDRLPPRGRGRARAQDRAPAPAASSASTASAPRASSSAAVRSASGAPARADRRARASSWRPRRAAPRTARGIPRAGRSWPSSSGERGPASARRSDVRGVGRRRIVLHHPLHVARVSRIVELAHQPERHVDAGRDARGRHQVAVAHVARSVDDGRRRRAGAASRRRPSAS